MKTYFTSFFIFIAAFSGLSQCTNLVISVTSNLDLGGPQVLNWSVVNNDTDEINSNGIMTFNAENNLTSVQACVPDGCWELTLEGESPLLQNQIVIEIMGPNGSFAPIDVIDWGENDIDFDFQLNAVCIDPDECQAWFDVVEMGLGQFNLFDASAFLGNASYSWSFGNGETSTDINPTIGFDENGLYEVCLTINTGACTSTRCLNLLVDDFVVDACPETLFATIGDCGFTSFSLGGDAPGLSVSWDYGDGQLSVGSYLSSHQFEAPGEYTVCASYTSDNCPQGVQLCSTVIIVECVNNSNCPDNISRDEIECGFFQFDIGDITAGVTTVWNFGDGSEESVNSNAVSHFFENPGDYNVCVTYYGPTCTDGVTVCEDVNVDDCGQTGCWIELADNEISDGVISFTVASPFPNADVIWTWGDSTFTGTNSITLDFEPGLYEVCAEIVNELCPGLFACANIGVEGDLCSPAFSATPEDNGAVEIENLTDFSLDATYSWDLGNGTTSSDYSPVVVYDAPGIYTICLTVTFQNCNNTICHDVMIGEGSCAAIFSIVTEDNGLYAMENESNAPLDAIYSWTFGDGQTSDEFAPQIEYATSGNYEICLTVTAGNCSNTSCQTIEVITLVESFNTTTVKVYPNPANDFLEIMSTSPLHSFHLKDMAGRTLKEGNIYSKYVSLDIAELPQGVFFLMIVSNDGIDLKKITVNR